MAETARRRHKREEASRGERQDGQVGEQPDPGRTPGQAEGTVGDVTGEGHPAPVDPGRTPGQAEGTVEDVTGSGHTGPGGSKRPAPGSGPDKEEGRSKEESSCE